MRQRPQIQILTSENQRVPAANHIEAGAPVEYFAFEGRGHLRWMAESGVAGEHDAWEADGLGAQGRRKSLDTGLFCQVLTAHDGRSDPRVGMDESTGEIEQDTG